MDDNVVDLHSRRKINNSKDISVERQDIEDYLKEAEAFQKAMAKKRDKLRRHTNKVLLKEARSDKTPDGNQ